MISLVISVCCFDAYVLFILTKTVIRVNERICYLSLCILTSTSFGYHVRIFFCMRNIHLI